MLPSYDFVVVYVHCNFSIECDTLRVTLNSYPMPLHAHIGVSITCKPSKLNYGAFTSGSWKRLMILWKDRIAWTITIAGKDHLVYEPIGNSGIMRTDKITINIRAGLASGPRWHYCQLLLLRLLSPSCRTFPVRLASPNLIPRCREMLLLSLSVKSRCGRSKETQEMVVDRE
jgi:hypothetical protein